MAIYWLLSGRVGFENSLLWGLGGNALYLAFLCISSGVQKSPNVIAFQIYQCAQDIFHSHHLYKVLVTPRSWDSALLPWCSPGTLTLGLG